MESLLFNHLVSDGEHYVGNLEPKCREADGKAFVERGREDRHQFRFIVAPEDATEMADLRGFTRDLMRQMELDLATRLDWIAVDHHNTGHPHTHIIVRGVLDDGRMLNIAGDYIAHGVRHRASEFVTRELGHQSEIELQAKLQNEVEAERQTRLDKMLLSEQQEQGVIDLRPSEGATWLVRENRNLMIGRVKHLERYGLATELEPGRWALSDRAAQVLKDLDHRTEVINTIHRALTKNGLTEERGAGQFVLHGEGSGEKIVGRVLAKGLAGDEMGERVRPIVDGIDGRVHHIEFKDPSRIEEVGRDMIAKPPPLSRVQDPLTATSLPMRPTAMASTGRADTWNASAAASSARAHWPAHQRAQA